MSNTVSTPVNPLEERVAALNALVATYHYREAHAEFYAEHFVKHENEDAPTIGLEAHRAATETFLNSISNATCTLLNTIVSDNMSVSEWHYRFDHAEWGHSDFKALSLQRWEDGKVGHERHCYSM